MADAAASGPLDGVVVALAGTPVAADLGPGWERALVEHAGSEFDFQFTVVESEEVNAFALPGGFVTVNMGLLQAAETGEEVAAVLAHEMTHVTHRHGMRAVLRKVGGLTLVAMIFGGTDFETLAFAMEGLASQAHSRDQERDADEGGREILMAAGIDPIGMATFFERLEQMQGSLPGAAVLLSLGQARSLLRREATVPLELPSSAGLAARLGLRVPSRYRVPLTIELTAFVLALTGAPTLPWAVLVAVGLARLWRWFAGPVRAHRSTSDP